MNSFSDKATFQQCNKYTYGKLRTISPDFYARLLLVVTYRCSLENGDKIIINAKENTKYRHHS